VFLSGFLDGFSDAFNGDTSVNPTLIKTLMIVGIILAAAGIAVLIKPDKKNIRKTSVKIIAWVCIVAGAILILTGIGLG
jgi:sulfite exporter TauE/SafE